MRVLHAIHDFLPEAQAGSEIYTFELCRALLDRGHHVTVVCATFNPERPHGHVHWRVFDGVPVVELTNNWICTTFEDTYHDPVINGRLESVLRAVQPDVVHVHNLLNLSFDLPRLARQHGARTVATLHDYTLVCPSGGQRLHRADAHVCRRIEPDRCARCFAESPFGTRAAWGRLARRQRLAGPLTIAARAVRAVAPRLTATVAAHLPTLPATEADIRERLAAAGRVFATIDQFIAPSPSIRTEFVALGLPAERVQVSDYGFRSAARRTRSPMRGGPLRVGFVGTPVWHKGVHVLIDAFRHLTDAQASLTIVGDLRIFPEFVAQLRAQANGLPVQFLGALPRTEVAGAYDAFDVLVVPSLWLENSPLVIHEAQVAGVPVVGADIGGIPDLVSHGDNGLLFEPGNAVALAGCLRTLADDRALLAHLSERALPVKSIDDDAYEWEERYRALLPAAVPATTL
ncbi:MAG TPA: glycosyltransferase family 4 protein [Vicinamibacterales bacterium]|nr:glycosyltransferase family 4 protein [Vicinamibacterales bacterium]